MNTDSYSDLHTKRPLKTITEHDVVEAIAHSGARGEIAVLERYTPYMLEGTLTKGALFQLAFLVEDADADSDRGLLYSAVVLHAANLVLGGDHAAWLQLRTRPGKLGAFLAALSGPESPAIVHDRRTIRENGTIQPRTSAPSPLNDIVDLVLSRLHVSRETLAYLHDHLQDAGMKAIVHGILRLKGTDFVPGNA
jgi:hypothetical protein